MTSLADWLAAARPKTLGAAVAPVIAGSVLGARAAGGLDWILLAATLGSCLAIQVATNFFNDALDHEKGADTALRAGPRRLTAAGAVSPATMKRAALLALGVALLASAPLILARGWPIIWIGLPSLYFSYGYTGGPAPLAYRGLGELFVILFFGLVAVTGSAFVQSGLWQAEALVAGLQIGCLSTVLIAINNLRDAAEDATTGKRTLAVRLGNRFARVEIAALHAVAYGGCVFWLAGSAPLAGLLPLAVLPLGLFVSLQVLRLEPGPALNRLLALSGAQLLAFAALFCAGVARAGT
jgi:1,4-dihydroxy-2-naphthoate octaprenyltransferase